MKTVVEDYQYIKSTRFYLEGDVERIYSPKEDFSGSKNFLGEFIETASDLVKNLSDRFSSEEHRKLIKIGNTWCKNHERFVFYTYLKGANSEKVAEVLFPKIQERLTEFAERLDRLKSLNSQFNNPEKETPRKSELRNLISELSSKKFADYICELAREMRHKNISTRDLKDQAEKMNNLLAVLREEFLSSGSSGIEVSRASFNYYALNKRPKEFDEERRNLEGRLGRTILEFVLREGSISYFWTPPEYQEFRRKKMIIPKFKVGELERDIISNDLACFFNKKKLNLEEAVDFLKLFKANLKSRLFELCSSASLEEISGLTKIFGEEQKLEAVYRLTKNIKELEKENNKIKLKRKKEDRGSYFFEASKDCFREWKKLINIYKNLSQEYGRLKAKRTAIEKNKVEVELLNHWALILGDGNKKYLLLVPRENRQKVKNALEKFSKRNLGEIKIYRFNSLTKRALDKLLFSQESSFFKEMASADPEMYNKLREARTAKENRDSKVLVIYRNILFRNYTRQRLEIKDFDLSGIDKARDIAEFSTLLEKSCYKMEEIRMRKDELTRFLEENKIIKCLITSYDLERRFERNKPASKPKRHTRDLWKAFWEDGSRVRLNPEVRINYRRRDPELENYLRRRGFNPETIHNRFLEDKYIATFTFTLNPGLQYPELAFVKTAELIDGIVSFNAHLNRKLLSGRNCFFGIDIGKVELATLCITSFKRTSHFNEPIRRENNLKPFMPKFAFYRLKKEKYSSNEYSNLEKEGTRRRKKRIISNMSYFTDKINDRDYFEKIESASLNLTCAKVIGGMIVENGDVLTYLQYLKKVSKRKIFRLLTEEKLQPPDCILSWEGDGNVLKLNGKEIYRFNTQYKGIMDKNGYEYSRDSLKKCFEKFINDFFNRNATIPNLNSLRDSLVANMIGVLSHLLERYPGYITLEYFERGRSEEEGEITKRLELALYRKLQTFGLVPPHVKNLLEIKEYLQKSKTDSEKTNNLKSIQIGNVIFVSKENTSKLCPACGEKCDEKTYKDYKRKREFYCPSCKFYTSEAHKHENLESLDNADKIASFNIAKRGFEYLEKWKKP